MNWLGKTPRKEVFSPVEYVEQVASDRFSVLCHTCFVDASLQGSNKLVAILFNHEAHELLLRGEAKA